MFACNTFINIPKLEVSSMYQFLICIEWNCVVIYEAEVRKIPYVMKEKVFTSNASFMMETMAKLELIKYTHAFKSDYQSKRNFTAKV